MSQAGGGDHMKYIKGNTQSFITRLLQQLSAISTAPGAMFPLQEEHLGVRSWSPHSCAGNSPDLIHQGIVHRKVSRGDPLPTVLG